MVASSSSSMLISSSSSHDLATAELNGVVINQNNYNLLPFTWLVETGRAIDLGIQSDLGFNFSVASGTSYVNYDDVLLRDNSSITTTLKTTSDTYLVQTDESQYKHQNSFHVDIIGKDVSGLKEVRTHVEPNAYQFEEIEDVFYIPKITWTDQEFSTASSTIYDDTFWAGTDTNKLLNKAYDHTSTVDIYEEDLASPVNGITLGKNTNLMYVSTKNKYYKYLVSQYSNRKEVYQETFVTNTNDGIISLYHNDIAWVVSSYDGKVIKLDADDLTTLGEYSGFDAPFKIRWSEYHALYFVAGASMLWTINNTTNTIESVYEINDYTIVDFDVSEDGLICMFLNGFNDDIIRILDYDLYTFKLNESITNVDLRFCRYCDEGRFYVLGELNTTTVTYAAIHYLYDSRTNILVQKTSSEAAATTTTTTTLSTTSKAVQVEFPNGGEQLQLGNTYEIKWISSKAQGDKVKIELVRGSSVLGTIVDSTDNTGIYQWDVPTTLVPAVNYKIKITWISASSDPNNYDVSDNTFEILASVSTTTTTTTTLISQRAVGIDYDTNNDQIVIMLQSGLLGIFALSESVFYGLVETGIVDPISFISQNIQIGVADLQSKVRVFVGSEQYYSDKWDSGVIETTLTSMYYGGGNNLEPGKKYYVHIQTYSETQGWSDVQIKEFLMPK